MQVGAHLVAGGAILGNSADQLFEHCAQRTCADFLVTVSMADVVDDAAATCPPPPPPPPPPECPCAEADDAAKARTLPHPFLPDADSFANVCCVCSAVGGASTGTTVSRHALPLPCPGTR